MIDFFLSNNRISVFLVQKKKFISQIHVKGFSITRGSNMFSIGSDTFWLKDFVNTNLKIILEDNFQPGACNVSPLLKNFRYNYNSTQNQIRYFERLQEIYWVLVL